jgi:hypothetical protein
VKDIFSHGCKEEVENVEEDIAQKLFLDSDLDADASGDKICCVEVMVTKKRQETDNTQSQHGVLVIHSFRQGPTGMWHNEAPIIHNDSSPPECLHALFYRNYSAVGGGDRHYQQYLDTLDEGCFPLPNLITQKIYSILTIIILQIGHDQKDMPKAYWSTAEQFSMSFYGKTVK